MTNTIGSAKELKKSIITEVELRLKIKTYLSNNFLFRKLEIDAWMGGDIRYKKIDPLTENPFA